ncbi:MAG TPA: diguanylate cyclase, partial [Terriglobales bacterium]|nr:diguanylate cyclase [Terriglobales bacterium]
MSVILEPEAGQIRAEQAALKLRKIEGREWWLWAVAAVVTLVLTLGIVSFTVPWFHISPEATWYWAGLRDWMRGLTALVLLFDIYTGYQHFQLYRTRRQLFEQSQLFQLISENAADMIAVEDREGRPLYHSPSFEKVLGYSPHELMQSPLEIHADDRQRVQEAAEHARESGHGQRLEYRVYHKNGTPRIMESTVNSIRNADGAVEKLVVVNRDITERKQAEEMLAHSALHDSLTSLPNRALFLDRLQRLCTLARRHADHKFAVLFVDLDEFKVVNESLGHEAGDELLVQVARRLTASLRGFDTIARPGANAEFQPADDTLAKLPGDEFAVLLDDIRDPSDAIRVADRTQAKLAEPFLVNAQEIVLSASIGIALNTSLQGAQELLRDAEIAMHRAKRAGKARSEVFDSAMHATAVARLQLETDLRKAMERGEMRVHYQPVVSLRDGR